MITVDEFELFNLICDAVTRAHIPAIRDDDGLLHTSDVARRYALRLIDELDDAGCTREVEAVVCDAHAGMIHDVAYYAALEETGKSWEGKDAASRIATRVCLSLCL